METENKTNFTNKFLNIKIFISGKIESFTLKFSEHEKISNIKKIICKNLTFLHADKINIFYNNKNIEDYISPVNTQIYKIIDKTNINPYFKIYFNNPSDKEYVPNNPILIDKFGRTDSINDENKSKEKNNNSFNKSYNSDNINYILNNSLNSVANNFSLNKIANKNKENLNDSTNNYIGNNISNDIPINLKKNNTLNFSSKNRMKNIINNTTENLRNSLQISDSLNFVNKEIIIQNKNSILVNDKRNIFDKINLKKSKSFSSQKFNKNKKISTLEKNSYRKDFIFQLELEKIKKELISLNENPIDIKNCVYINKNKIQEYSNIETQIFQIELNFQKIYECLSKLKENLISNLIIRKDFFDTEKIKQEKIINFLRNKTKNFSYEFEKLSLNIKKDFNLDINNQGNPENFAELNQINYNLSNEEINSKFYNILNLINELKIEKTEINKNLEKINTNILNLKYNHLDIINNLIKNIEFSLYITETNKTAFLSDIDKKLQKSQKINLNLGENIYDNFNNFYDKISTNKNSEYFTKINLPKILFTAYNSTKNTLYKLNQKKILENKEKIFSYPIKTDKTFNFIFNILENTNNIISYNTWNKKRYFFKGLFPNKFSVNKFFSGSKITQDPESNIIYITGGYENTDNLIYLNNIQAVKKCFYFSFDLMNYNTNKNFLKFFKFFQNEKKNFSNNFLQNKPQENSSEIIEVNNTFHKVQDLFYLDLIEVSPMNCSRWGHSTILIQKKYLLCISGYENKKCEYLDLVSKKWKNLPDINISRIDSTLFYFNEKFLYIFGGAADNINLLTKNKNSELGKKNNYFYNVKKIERLKLNSYTLEKNIFFEKNWEFLNVFENLQENKSDNYFYASMGIIKLNESNIILLGGDKNLNYDNFIFNYFDKLENNINLQLFEGNNLNKELDYYSKYDNTIKLVCIDEDGELIHNILDGKLSRSVKFGNVNTFVDLMEEDNMFVGFDNNNEICKIEIKGL